MLNLVSVWLQHSLLGKRIGIIVAVVVPVTGIFYNIVCITVTAAAERFIASHNCNDTMAAEACNWSGKLPHRRSYWLRPTGAWSRCTLIRLDVAALFSRESICSSDTES